MDTRLNVIDDPRLTAYALGELKGAQREEIEHLLRASPEARAEVEAIRRMAGALTYELAGELPHPHVEGATRSVHERNGHPAVSRIARAAASGAKEPPLAGRGWRVGPRLTMAALATTAALIAVVLAITSQRGFGPAAQRQAIKDPAAATQVAEVCREASAHDHPPVASTACAASYSASLAGDPFAQASSAASHSLATTTAPSVGYPTASTGVSVGGLAPASGAVVRQATSAAAPCCDASATPRPDLWGTAGPVVEYGAGSQPRANRNYTICKSTA